MDTTTEPVAARDIVPGKDLSDTLQRLVDRIQKTRNALQQETFESNDPSELIELKKQFEGIRNALIAFIRVGDSKGLARLAHGKDTSDPYFLQTLVDDLGPLVNKTNFSETCEICSVIDSLFLQAPFTPNPSHALRLQENISKD